MDRGSDVHAKDNVSASVLIVMCVISACIDELFRCRLFHENVQISFSQQQQRCMVLFVDAVAELTVYVYVYVLSVDHLPCMLLMQMVIARWWRILWIEARMCMQRIM